MTDKTWPEKLSDSIEQTAGKAVRDEVMPGWEQIVQADEAAKAEWSGRALRKLEQLVPRIRTRKEIMARCACTCLAQETIVELRDFYRRTEDIDKLLDAMYRNPFYVRPVREGHTIYFTKAPFDEEKHNTASTPEERQYYYCHCEYARAAGNSYPITHCYCGAGWYRNILESILERPIEIEVVKSVLQGDDCCRIAAYLK